MLYRHLLVLLAAGALLLGGCANPVSREPRNLNLLKYELNAYIDSGDYARGIATVAARARGWIEERAGQKKPGERPALILDIDETMLSNLPIIRRFDYGYVPDAWNAWVASGQCLPIEPVREAYRAAVARGVSVFIVTGRRDRDREGTLANLKAAGYTAYAGIYFQADDSTETPGAVKLAWRRLLAAEGYTHIANLGDQDSDFAGGGAER
ncbi:MAG: HAD family acid phosphatase, partial [Opitutales bacterium]